MKYKRRIRREVEGKKKNEQNEKRKKREKKKKLQPFYVCSTKNFLPVPKKCPSMTIIATMSAWNKILMKLLEIISVSSSQSRLAESKDELGEED